MIPLGIDSLTVTTDPLFKRVWWMGGEAGTPAGDADRRGLNHQPQNQLWLLLEAYARWEILTIADMSGVALDRDLSTLVPARVRKAAAISLRHAGLIEHAQYKSDTGWRLTGDGREFVATHRREAA